MEAEILSHNDVITCLWNKNASEKCRIGLADAMLYENGHPSQWYFTGKTGEILKKRTVDIDSLSNRWKRIAAQTDSAVIAIMRQQGGILKFLGEDAWQSLCELKGVTDNSVCSVHCFVKGDNQCIYRNKFEVKDKLGRCVTTTHSYSYNSGQHGPDALNVVSENLCKFIESKATALKNIMDLATHTVVKYVENILGVKVLKMSIDYVIDTKSQLWMMWTSEATICRVSSYGDIQIPGFPSGDKLGRMTWAGFQYAEAELDAEHYLKTQQLKEPTSPTLRSPQLSSPLRVTRSRQKGTEERKISPTQAGALLASATTVIEQSVESLVKSRRKRNTDVNPVHSVEQSEKKGYKENNFPDPFKCKGDFCRIRVQHAGDLVPDRDAIKHSVDKFFTQKELNILRKDKRFASMMEFGADGPGLANISMKSIILARKEQRALGESDHGTRQSWDEYPITPRQKSTLNSHLNRLRRTGVLGLVDGVESINADDVSIASVDKHELERQQEIEKVLTEDKNHREAFTKAIAGYYDNVKVCGICFNVYNMLDNARGILGLDDAHGAGLEAAGGGSPLKQPHDATKVSRKFTQSISDSASIGLSNSITSEPPPIEDFPNEKIQVSPTTKRKTWRDQAFTNKGTVRKQKVPVKNDQLVDIEEYLRSGAKSLADRKAKEKENKARTRLVELAAKESSVAASQSLDIAQNMYRGKILLGYEDSIPAYEARTILEEAFFDVHWCKDGRQAYNEFSLKDGAFDCVLLQRDLHLWNAFDVVKKVRDFEKTERKKASAAAAASGSGIAKPTKRHPVICFTDATAPEDLKAYMQADMDGCVSYPLNKSSLLNTVRAAVPHHLALLAVPEPELDKNGVKVYKMGNLGVLEGSTDSSTQALKTLPIGTASPDEEYSTSGVVQIDADTRIPYSVLDSSAHAKVLINPNKPFFNLIVCHDLFDTAERMKIFFKPIVQKYLGMQILIWNYPGQAFTEYREEQLLNNEYHATCLNELLGQVGERGTKDFDTSRPFYIMGFGNGTSIASFYAAYFRVPNLRGFINVNGWSYVDSYLAGVMHDCVNIFQCAPPSRPDLPVYFFSRFLFAKEYLAKVSVPLALNIYTAVHNPITLSGRISLCKGVLQAVDVRSLLREIDCPVICIHSTQNSLARPLHTEPFTLSRGGEVRSIYKVLQEPTKTCVVWMKSGHEIFQENKKHIRMLLEQILTGFHETHDIAFPPAPMVDKTSADQGLLLLSNLPGQETVKTVEDKFIDNILGNMNRMQSPGALSQQNNRVKPLAATQDVGTKSQPTSVEAMNKKRDAPPSIMFSSSDPQAWEDYAYTMASGQIIGKMAKSKQEKLKHESLTRIFDPTLSIFERQDSVVYGPKRISHPGVNPSEFSEVKEFMGWRLKRNKKRLQRLQGAARIIQGGFRAYLARQFVKNIRRRKAAMIIQRAFRGWLGRCAFLTQARRIWATQVIQRAWRGYLGRKLYFFLKLRIASAAQIQRVYRGHRARLRVAKIVALRNHAACIIQALFRRAKARKDAWRRREERNAAVLIQRTYRGRIGRRKALAERDKYIFSRSQSQGIEFGRQMLLEHKLHATRLQSDVTLLTQEKVASEEQVEALLEEISGFEDGVRTLEKEMHQLSKVEAEAAAFMDEDSKYELREQKMRLDKEFGEMLAKIGNRKDMLNDLEKKLSTIDKARQGKEEELRTLERKLVVLLEEQQNELNAIKRKQDVRGALLAASHDELAKLTTAVPGSQSQALIASTAGMAVKGGSGGGGGGGPSLQEKKQAAQLMQSTETLMKFGFMSMSMTYFSSLNMIKALRTVSAQDTVMAALADVHAQKAVGFNGTSGSGGDAGSGGGHIEGKSAFMPNLKGGQLPGQEALRVSAWSVEDVAKWMQTLSLGQYTEAFIDAAVDGEFLYDLNDDDLKNTLGIEHRLHRKKILNCVHRLKIAEAHSDSRINALLRESGSIEAPQLGPDSGDDAMQFPELGAGLEGNTAQERIDGPKIPITELMSLVRHSKFTLLKEALDYLPNKRFDKSLIQTNYVLDHGTVYVDGYDRLPFHINKVDENGNILLSLACQNGNEKIAKWLVAKGSNPNHQNNNGQTPAHFCISYKFFELSQWLFENGAIDTLENKFGLTPYDGLSNEDGGD